LSNGALRFSDPSKLGHSQAIDEVSGALARFGFDVAFSNEHGALKVCVHPWQYGVAW
jgi:hypothetical protein